MLQDLEEILYFREYPYKVFQGTLIGHGSKWVLASLNIMKLLTTTRHAYRI